MAVAHGNPVSTARPTIPSKALYDEMYLASGEVRPHYAGFAQWFASQSGDAMSVKRAEADLLFRRIGITFSLSGDDGGTERLIPSDLIPRIIDAAAWDLMEQGLVQRVKALNRFLHDVYHEQAILRAGIVPAEQVLSNAQFLPLMMGLNLPHETYAHVVGVDIVRHSDGRFYVLEDNLRVPSGVSYMLSNRKMMMRLFPDLFQRVGVRPVEHYPALLLQTLRSSSLVDDPTVVVLTPGRYNAAYFEH
ncbi:MAG: circularly permuted type 2 ATP-grasp protein, partial [Betaproteobacteria bacterium]|nr:circularly permuted type 2 ATP-grasp protein [Betaproteobacteria bacterium]